MKKRRMAFTIMLAFLLSALTGACGCHDNSDVTENGDIEQSVISTEEAPQEEDQSEYSVRAGFNINFSSKAGDLEDEEIEEMKYYFDMMLTPLGYDELITSYDIKSGTLRLSATKMIHAEDYDPDEINYTLTIEKNRLEKGPEFYFREGRDDENGEILLSKENIFSAKSEYLDKVGSIIKIDFTSEGKELYGEMTLKYLYDHISVWEGNNCIAFKYIDSVFKNGVMYLNEDFTQAEAERISSELNSKLPFSLYVKDYEFIIPTQEEREKALKNVPWCIKSGDTKVSAGIWNYYLYESIESAFEYTNKDTDLESSTIEGKPAKEWIYDRALKRTLEYLYYQTAGNDNIGFDKEEYNQNSLYDSYDDFTDNNGENIFSRLGITKKSYTAAKSFPEYVRDKLFTYLYGTGGAHEVSDSKIKKYFTDNYISYIYFYIDISEYGTEGNMIYTDDNHVREIYLNRFKNYANMINNSGKTFSQASEQFKADFNSENYYPIHEDNKKSDMSDSKFDKALIQAKEGEAFVLSSDDNLYLCYRIDINKRADEIFSRYSKIKDNIFHEMKDADLEKYIADGISSLKYEKNGEIFEKYSVDRAISILKSV